MRGKWAASEPTSQGLTKSTAAVWGSNNAMMASRAMRLKLGGKLSREVSERRQVGDAEAMFSQEEGAWWRDIGMEEGL